VAYYGVNGVADDAERDGAAASDLNRLFGFVRIPFSRFLPSLALASTSLRTNIMLLGKGLLGLSLVLREIIEVQPVRLSRRAD
jgi:hypothetical protein